MLCRLYPLDRTRNADGLRRVLDPISPEGQAAPAPEPGIAPLLRKLMADSAATGLPPAYLPKDGGSLSNPNSTEREDETP